MGTLMINGGLLLSLKGLDGSSASVDGRRWLLSSS